MDIIDSISPYLEAIALPPVLPVRQRLPGAALADPEAELNACLGSLPEQNLAGSSVAITCGSRGFDGYAALLRGLVFFLRDKGARPFLVPAMGSHGGAAAAGQTALLGHLGITEDAVGAPIRSSMETVLIGETARGLPVRIDKLASQADGIVLLNRIKPHTSFRGPYESGLLKMLAVGLGKQAGAEATHRRGYGQMAENLQAAGTLALQKLPVLFALATLENGLGKLAEIHVLQPDQILAREPLLLEKARSLMPRIWLDEIDVLVVGEIGKDISGTGMDTNIVGRYHTTAASGGPRVTRLGILSLSAGSEGNANGMGLADFMTERLYRQVDFAGTYLNTLTSTEPASARMPMLLANDRQVFQAAVKLCGQDKPDQVRLAVIRNTKSLETLWLSPAAWTAASRTGQVSVQGPARPLSFTPEGRLCLFDTPAGSHREDTCPRT